MILGGSNHARKTHGQRFKSYEIGTKSQTETCTSISFYPQDLEGVVTPHEDELLIRVVIVNYNVAQIFIDMGSSVNVLFK